MFSKNKISNIKENKAKIKNIFVVFLFIISQFLFFGWALGQFIEPSANPLDIIYNYVIDTGPVFQNKEGKFTVGGISFSTSSYEESPGGKIYLRDNSLYIQGIKNGFIIGGEENSPKLILAQENSSGNLLMEAKDGGIFLAGDQIESAGVKIPPKGSFCGMARKLSILYSITVWKNLYPCNGFDIAIPKGPGNSVIKNLKGSYEIGIPDFAVDFRCPDGFTLKHLIKDKIVTCVYGYATADTDTNTNTNTDTNTDTDTNTNTNVPSLPQPPNRPQD